MVHYAKNAIAKVIAIQAAADFIPPEADFTGAGGVARARTTGAPVGAVLAPGVGSGVSICSVGCIVGSSVGEGSESSEVAGGVGSESPEEGSVPFPGEGAVVATVSGPVEIVVVAIASGPGEVVVAWAPDEADASDPTWWGAAVST